MSAKQRMHDESVRTEHRRRSRGAELVTRVMRPFRTRCLIQSRLKKEGLHFPDAFEFQKSARNEGEPLVASIFELVRDMNFSRHSVGFQAAGNVYRRSPQVVGESFFTYDSCYERSTVKANA